jgi:hypothetical protein
MNQMKHYFFFLLLIGFIALSSFIMHRNSKTYNVEIVTSDSTPAIAKTDSVWIMAGYGWTHHTYHWIPAHWEAAGKKKKSTETTTVKSATVDSIGSKDSTTTKIVSKDSIVEGRIWVKGHRELQHNNYVWVPGKWVAAPGTITK